MHCLNLGHSCCGITDTRIAPPIDGLSCSQQRVDSVHIFLLILIILGSEAGRHLHHVTTDSSRRTSVEAVAKPVDTEVEAAAMVETMEAPMAALISRDPVPTGGAIDQPPTGKTKPPRPPQGMMTSSAIDRSTVVL